MHWMVVDVMDSAELKDIPVTFCAGISLTFSICSTIPSREVAARVAEKLEYHEGDKRDQKWLPSSKLKPTAFDLQNMSIFPSRRKPLSRNKGVSLASPVVRLFGPSVFEASKLKVLFLGVD
ncbi:hypothetical protein LINPERPRIM_LOCUS2436 [Linum perenne]